MYNRYSEYLKKRYGQKVYKLPVELPVTCPNRDGNIGYGGCIYCDSSGSGFDGLSTDLSVDNQLKKNMIYIGKRYGAKKFIAYFQNYTNTYIPLNEFRKNIASACLKDIVGIAISTRPDCINKDYLKVLKQLEENQKVDIFIELGLQTTNYHTLKKINRGHTLAEFIDAVLLIKKYSFNICAHIIIGLPWDNMDDVIECSKILSALKIDQVKLHALYILENTKLGDMYKMGKINTITLEEYVDMVVAFLVHLDPNIVIQRLAGRAPKEGSLFVNWATSWWRIRDMIEEKMTKLCLYQGEKFSYLGGSCLTEIEEN